MKIFVIAIIVMIPAIILFIVFMNITYKEEIDNLLKKIKKKTNSKIADIQKEKKEDTIIDFNEEFYKIIKPDGTEFFRKKPNPVDPIKVHTNEILPYAKREILTNTEWKFWAVLDTKCEPYKIIICPKVRMEDFLTITANYKQRKIYEAYRNKIKSRHIDFILCNRNMRILAGIELDDKTHLTKEAQKADEMKNAVFNSIGIPLYRIKTNSNYAAWIDIMLKDIFKD